MKTYLLEQEPTIAQGLQHALKYFLIRCQISNFSAQTTAWYDRRLSVFFRFIQEQDITQIQDITHCHIREFLYFQKTRKNEKNPKVTLSPFTIHSYYRTLKAFFNYFVREDWIKVNPVQRVERIRLPKRIAPSLSENEVKRVLSSFSGNSFIETRGRFIITMLCDTGIRAGELIGIKISDIDIDGQSFKVFGKGAKERICPMGLRLTRELIKYLKLRGEIETDSEHLLITPKGKPLGFWGLETMMRRLSKKLNIHLHPHKFRHSFSKFYIRNGGDGFSLQKLLGHADFGMVRNYVSMFSSDVIEQHKKYSPMDKLH